MIWSAWVLLTLLICGYLGYRLLAEEADKSVFLLGETTHGHHQIELSCASCHSSAFGGGEVLQNACVDCHADALSAANDTHPRTKFTDPRNADRLEKVNATQCITCHREHKPDMTHPMGLTLPMDFCFHCHEDIAEERISHEGMGFDTCASAGCHNYHDNRALYEDFLLAHGDEPHILPQAQVLTRWLNEPDYVPDYGPDPTLSPAEQDAPPEAELSAQVLDEWHHSAHAQAGVNCSGCHSAGGQSWDPTPNHTACAECHSNEVDGFLSGLHGMRLAEGLSPMRPEMANLPMRSDAHGKELGCASCHSDHRFETVTAAVDSCLSCHADDHSLAYKQSPHHDLWRREQAGELPPGSGVSCATCHLPRETHREGREQRVRVQHNQNDNLRPVEAMARSVCMDCHGLGFTLDALADPALRANNFRGQPDEPVASIEMAQERLRRQQERRRSDSDDNQNR